MAFGNATKGYVKKHSGGGGGGGTSNYNELSNKPQINGVTLSGNKTSEELGITGGSLEFTRVNANEGVVTIPSNFKMAIITLRDASGNVANNTLITTFCITNTLTDITMINLVCGESKQLLRVTHNDNNTISFTRFSSGYMPIICIDYV